MTTEYQKTRSRKAQARPSYKYYSIVYFSWLQSPSPASHALSSCLLLKWPQYRRRAIAISNLSLRLPPSWPCRALPLPMLRLSLLQFSHHENQKCFGLPLSLKLIFGLHCFISTCTRWLIANELFEKSKEKRNRIMFPICNAIWNTISLSCFTSILFLRTCTVFFLREALNHCPAAAVAASPFDAFCGSAGRKFGSLLRGIKLPLLLNRSLELRRRYPSSLRLAVSESVQSIGIVRIPETRWRSTCQSSIISAA